MSRRKFFTNIETSDLAMKFHVKNLYDQRMTSIVNRLKFKVTRSYAYCLYRRYLKYDLFEYLFTLNTI